MALIVCWLLERAFILQAQVVAQTVLLNEPDDRAALLIPARNPAIWADPNLEPPLR